MIAFLCFGMVWFVFFLQASNNYVVMVTAATYYFNSSREETGSGEMGTAFRYAWINNFGSLAFGSLIIAIIFTIRVIAYYVCKKAEKMSGDNAAIRCISCAVQCFLKCLEEIIEYINKAAYAFMAISG
jgi:choline transporter-like protein 2/4/5